MTFYLESINDITVTYLKPVGFPDGASSKEPACQCRRHKSGGLGRSPGEGHGNPLLCSCLEKPMGRGAWQAIYIVHWVAKS